ncbi:MAG: PAS domain S-box protein [Verrucomicrobia bacterium]|nr:PAS domain S-box protein [Verrucomicrobiota bacterium]
MTGPVMDPALETPPCEPPGDDRSPVHTGAAAGDVSLEGTERHFLGRFEHARELILIVEPGGTLVFANAAWRAALGYELHEIADLSLFDVTHRADHAVCQAWLTRPESDLFPSETRIIFRSRAGDHVPLEGLTNTRMGDPQRVFLKVEFRDVSREWRTETALHESAELFHLLTSHTPLGVFRTDPDGRLTYTSIRWRQIAGLTHVEQPRGVWWQIVHPGDREPVLAQWRNALRQSHEFSAEFRIHAGSAVERWCRLRMSLSTGPDGVARGGIGTTEDITESREAALALRRAHDDLEERVRARTSELESANHELAEFAYVVSHDLKAPLRGVSLLSEWLAQDYADRLGPEGVALFHKLRHRVQEMHSLVDGVLSYMRIGRAVAEPETGVPIGPLVEGILQSLACPDGIRFEVPPSLPVVRGLPTQLRQVFQNLLDNAVKFLGQPSGTVTIGARRLEEEWEFSVRDSGRGIDPRHHARIFQIFQRLHPNPDVPGTGIGLALVKRIIELRGGRITVDSQEGSGATFRFVWPDEPRGPSPAA